MFGAKIRKGRHWEAALLKWLKNWFSQDPDPLPLLGFQPKFFESDAAPPGSVSVVMQNDDGTELIFVAQVLNEYFGFKVNKAVELAMNVHEEGSANIRIMSETDADRIVHAIHELAGNRGFSLQLSITANDSV